MKISEICTRAPKCISPDDFVVDAAQVMKLLGVGMLPVCDNDRLVGSITDRDITVRAIANDLDPRATTVRSIMTREVVYCYDNQDTKEAARLMEENQIRRLPVLSQSKRLVGILSLGDLAVRTGELNLAGEVLERISEPVFATA